MVRVGIIVVFGDLRDRARTVAVDNELRIAVNERVLRLLTLVA